MTYKHSTHLLGMLSHIENFRMPMSMKVLINERFFMSSFVAQVSVVLSICAFLSLKHNFTRLIFSFKKFQEIGTKSLFLSFQNSFSARYFPIST